MTIQIKRPHVRSTYKRRYETAFRDLYCLVLKYRGVFDSTIGFRQLRSKNLLTESETIKIKCLTFDLVTRGKCIMTSKEYFCELLFPNEERFSSDFFKKYISSLESKVILGEIVNKSLNEARQYVKSSMEKYGENFIPDDPSHNQIVKFFATFEIKKHTVLPVTLSQEVIEEGMKAKEILDNIFASLPFKFIYLNDYLKKHGLL